MFADGILCVLSQITDEEVNCSGPCLLNTTKSLGCYSCLFESGSAADFFSSLFISLIGFKGKYYCSGFEIFKKYNLTLLVD